MLGDCLLNKYFKKSITIIPPSDLPFIYTKSESRTKFCLNNICQCWQTKQVITCSKLGIKILHQSANLLKIKENDNKTALNSGVFYVNFLKYSTLASQFHLLTLNTYYLLEVTFLNENLKYCFKYPNTCFKSKH